jgi:YidC/Oxa1 family membrane protein insertase
MSLFNSILYIPFLNLLVFLYNTIAFNDFGVAIILLTLIIRLILSPLSIKTFKSQKALSELQPKIKEIQQKFKDDREQQTRQIMDLYRKHKVNPFSGCLPLLIQLPVLIALYKVSTAGFEANSLSALYDFIKNPVFLNSISLGFIDLTQKSILLSFVAGISQFFQARLSLSFSKNSNLQKDQKSNPLASMNEQMLYFLPLITIIVSISFPAGLPLYWIATTLFSILEQAYINRSVRPQDGFSKDNGKSDGTKDSGNR